MPDTPEPSTMHASPATPLPVTSTHLFAFQNVPPSFAHAVHFCPSSQSCTFGSHSFAGPPPSGCSTKPTPSSSLGPVSSVALVAVLGPVPSIGVVLGPSPGSSSPPALVSATSAVVPLSVVVSSLLALPPQPAKRH